MKVKNRRVVEISHVFSETFYALRKYNWTNNSDGPAGRQLVFMVDDSGFYTGGLADRFKGAVSAYAWCLCNGIDFKIRYTFPFELSDYLLPAEHDWVLKPNEFSRNLFDTKLMYARGEHGRRLLALKTSKRQIHYYGNMDVLPAINTHYGTSYGWGELFRRLFKPCPILQQRIEEIQSSIGAPYFSAVFRFQNLLGDFEEYHFKSESDKTKREEVISKCLDGIRNLQTTDPGMPVLVTSDSVTFLERAAALEGVHVIPGKVVHVGSKGGEKYDTYLKSFVDFYMLAGSTKIYGLATPEMYKSEFPMYAAKVNDIPFERISL